MKKNFITFCSFVLVLMSGAQATHAMTVAPSVVEEVGSRGEIIESQISILNTGTSEQTYYLSVLDFEPVDETGTPQFFAETQNSIDLTSWINFPVSEIAVPAQTAVDAPFAIVIPDDIPSGGYYAAIRVSQSPTDVIASNGAVIEASAAILVLLTVEGETEEKIQILDLKGPENGELFGEYTLRVQNQGNVHVTPTGEIQMSGTFGTVAASAQVNAAEGRVLPGTTRSYTMDIQEPYSNVLEKIFWQIKYGMWGGIELRAELDQGDEVSIQRNSVPWEATVIISLLAMILGIFAFKHRT